MKLRIMSDLHLDFHRDQGISFSRSIKKEGDEILVLAGDICDVFTRKDQNKSLIACQMLEGHFNDVLRIAGNHEYYHPKADFSTTTTREKYIKDQHFVLVEGWYNPKINPTLFQNWSDFHYIPGAEKYIYRAWQLDMEFLFSKVKKDSIVISHFLPSWNSVHPKYAGDPNNIFFAIDKDIDLVETLQPKLWIHGHTHLFFDYQLGNTRVVANPLGYVGQNPGFNDKFTVEV